MPDYSFLASSVHHDPHREHHSHQEHHSHLACRDLPRLIDIVQGGAGGPGGVLGSGGLPRPGGRAAAMNVQLSADETYADITPLRQPDALSAFVSIMRGCNNSEPVWWCWWWCVVWM